MKNQCDAIHDSRIRAARFGLGDARMGVAPRSAFTLVELLVTISVIAIMATFVMFASYSAMESAKEAKTKATINKLNNMIMAKFEGFRTRRVAIPPMPGASVTQVAQARLDRLRELMRLELPQRWSDIDVAPTTGIARPAVSQAYLRRYQQGISNGVPPNLRLHQSAECLFLIVTLGMTDEIGGRDQFNDSNIGDIDGDGFQEFLDAWGNPIRFLRWPTGFPSELQNGQEGTVQSASSADSFTGNAALDGNYLGCSVLFTSGNLKGQSRQVLKYDQASHTFGFDTPQPPSPNPQVPVRQPQFPSAPSGGDSFFIRPADPFDPHHVYPNTTQPMSTFALYPLIYSAGPDEIFDIVTDIDDSLNLNNYPYYGNNDPTNFPNGPLGSIADLDSANRSGSSPPNGVNNASDNIHNHLLETRVNR